MIVVRKDIYVHLDNNGILPVINEDKITVQQFSSHPSLSVNHNSEIIYSKYQ